MTSTMLVMYCVTVVVSLAAGSPWKAGHSVARLICRQSTSGADNCTATVFHESWALTTKSCVANCKDISLLMKINNKNTLIAVTNVHKHHKTDKDGQVNFNLALLELGYNDVICDVKGDFPELLTKAGEMEGNVRGQNCSTGCLEVSWPSRTMCLPSLLKKLRYPSRIIKLLKRSGIKGTPSDVYVPLLYTSLGQHLTYYLRQLPTGPQSSSTMMSAWLQASAKMSEAFLDAAATKIATGNDEVNDLVNCEDNKLFAPDNGQGERQLCFQVKPVVCEIDVGKPIICDGKLAGMVTGLNSKNGRHWDGFVRLDHQDYVDWISDVTRLFSTG